MNLSPWLLQTPDLKHSASPFKKEDAYPSGVCLHSSLLCLRGLFLNCNETLEP